MNACGIYEIVNSITGTTYIGSAINIEKRWYEHRKHLKKGIHHSQYLQRSWKKYGEESFMFRPLLLCAKKDLIFYEQRAINSISPKYNVCKIAGSMLGFKHSGASLEKIRTMNIGRKHSEESRKNMSAGKVGKKKPPFTDEHKKKLSLAHKGKNTGPRPSWIGERISAAKVGKPQIRTPDVEAERCRKISLARKGLPWSQNMRDSYNRRIAEKNNVK